MVLNAEHLTSDMMQQFARWTNLSETTFVFPPSCPEADYKVRIFTQSRELPFAGHPTLGTCFAWLHNGGISQNSDLIIQECPLGLIKLQRGGVEAYELSFEAPEPLRSGPLDEADLILISKGLGIDRSSIIKHSWCDNGPKWRGVMLGSMAEVLAVRPDYTFLKGMDVGVIGPVTGENTHDFDYEVRAFCDEGGFVLEDPVTGSLNAALAQWLMRGEIAPLEYVARQGTMIGRNGRIKLSMKGDDRKIWVSGKVTLCIDGVLRI